ncbi:hypothetical protein SAMN05216344_101294 [Polaromonas sp. OV174]|uniref:hypothetical protein n=1 Tax=Polaromonas sp. OV174 TaxID=1855300 RepID=UPI0008E59DEF|nr:hypothetical protein [Polaromonas sp. OV174]SFB69510.1 hypothetical protein SAMN05216344_101294 [Polaromonas sp. OV174]
MRPSLHFHLSKTGKILSSVGLTALLAMTAATAQVAPSSTGIDASGNPKNEMAACINGSSQEAKATCITEVKNANAAKRAGKLENGDGQFAANALKRCDVFKTDDDKVACRARIEGQGKIEGSIAGGGVLREAETVISPTSQ